MSVYKRPGAPTYSFDFQLRGRRFSGDTGKATKREAVAEERLRLDGARIDIAEAVALDAPSTWELAASRYWIEIGQHHKNAESTVASLDWLTRHIGKHTTLRQIDDNVVAGLVARRRVERRQVGRDRGAQRAVAPATVNRTMTEPLRKVLHRAEKVWRVAVGQVEWSKHMLAEPKERVREASPGEEGAILSELSRGYDEAMQFAFDTGVRRMEIVTLKKTMVDFFSRQFTVMGKGNRSRVIPMSQKTYEQLWRLKDNPTESVFTFVAARTDRRKGLIKGQSYPITTAGLRTAQRRAIDKAGIVNFRPHDTRHTTATRVLRKSNLRVVQILLGHADVTTTAKYAHALVEDVRAGLDAASPTESPTKDGPTTANVLKDRGKL